MPSAIVAQCSTNCHVVSSFYIRRRWWRVYNLSYLNFQNDIYWINCLFGFLSHFAICCWYLNKPLGERACNWRNNKNSLLTRYLRARQCKSWTWLEYQRWKSAREVKPQVFRVIVKPRKPWTSEIFSMLCYRKESISREKIGPQTVTVISLWFWCSFGACLRVLDLSLIGINTSSVTEKNSGVHCFLKLAIIIGPIKPNRQSNLVTQIV